MLDSLLFLEMSLDIVYYTDYKGQLVVLFGLVVIMIDIGPKVREFKPGRGRFIFKGDTNS
jgi:hypothetical protein